MEFLHVCGTSGGDQRHLGKRLQEAIQEAIAHANKTLRNVNGVWIMEQTVVVVDGTVSEYRVDMKLTYIPEA